MSTCATAKRRRTQARNGYTHICAKARPHYKKRTAEASAAHLQRVIAVERRMSQKPKK